MGIAVGIDLGTTNTVVAAVRDGVAMTLADGEGNKLIPSVVAFHPNGTVQVGWPALERRIIDPENTVYSVKRLIGRSFVSAEVRDQKSRFPFELVEGPQGATLVSTRAETYALPEISAFVLRRAKAIAESALGETVDAAVITVPANFDDPQRASTKMAGKLAGLEVLRILNEPTAAALAYGRTPVESERLCVYDLGGGTFDVTLLDVASGVFEVLATAGDSALGGDDIDALIVERMRDMAMRTLRVDPKSDPVAVARMRVAAEKLKKDLSFATDASVEVEGIGRGEGGAPLTLKCNLSRADLERITQPLVDRTMAVTRTAMGAAKLDVDVFDRVILVGGATRMPLVFHQVRDFFKKKPDQRINPEEVVALGAAIQANALGARKRGKKPPPPSPDDPPPTPRVHAHMGMSAPPPEVSHALTKKTAILAPAPKPILPRTGKTMDGVGPVESPKTAARAKGDAKGGGRPSSSPPRKNEKKKSVPPIHTRPTRPTMRKVGEVQEVRAKRFDPRAEPEDDGSSPPEPLPAVPDLPPTRPPLGAARGRDKKPAPDQASGEPTSFRAPTKSLQWSSIPPALGPVADADADAKAPSLFTPVPAPPPVPALPSEARAAKPKPPPPPPAKKRTREIELDAADLHDQTPLEVDRVESLLIDVTPHSLRVETVGGYSDPLIGANSQVPCDRTRVFSTASDAQTQVFIRVAQGESAMFVDNTFLGELELSGLVPLPRGEAQIAVTFEIDADGILAVRAKDGRTGKETAAKMHVFGTQTEDRDLTEMLARQAKRAVV